MRKNVVKLCLTLLIGLLCTSMACAEVSEFVSLRDDTSNDFTLQIFSDSGKALSIHVLKGTPPTHSAIEKRTAAQIDTLVSVSTPAGTTQNTGVDLLHLLSILRR